jgi:peptidyl-prolyl cis-trans isomerase A (cyclophilin A)
MEGLEGRLLMAAPGKVISASADNRGEVVLSLSRTVTGVSKSSVKLFTVGADNIIGTVDDVRQPSQVIYTPANNRITIKGKLVAGAKYRIRLQADLIKTLDGRKLDGEFNGATIPSGDGHPGGNYAFIAKQDKSSTTPQARFYTSAGNITVQLDAAKTPITVTNFMNYMNKGKYDGTIFHRDGRADQPPLGPISIIQGGGYTSTTVDAQGNPTGHITTFAPIKLEQGLQNTRGTIAMARTNAADSATSEWFFNQSDNAFLNPTGPGTGYAAFGTITKGVEVVDAIYNAPVAAPNSTFTTVPQVNNANVVVRRIAILDKLSPVPT